MAATIITESELQTVIAGCDVEMRVAMLLSHRLGLRVAEIAASDWKWVLTASMTLADVCDVPAVSTKGCLGAGVLPMAGDLQDALLALWIARGYPTRGAIIRAHAGAATQAVSANALRMRIKSAYAAAGMDAASSHSGRRSLGTAAARAMNLPSVMTILRHHDVSSTLHYVAAADDATISNFLTRAR